jgi:glycosyltransferase involved in cell wall biosynthesis
MTPRISVVVPTFDRAGVLGRSLDSVLGQTLPPLEVIVVDDGSTDETERVVGERDAELVRYVRQPRRSGAQAARNRGIGEAQGDWIAFQDSDDEWLPDKLERQAALLAERNFDPWTVAHGSGVVRDADGLGKEMGRRLLGEEDALDVLLRRPATLFPALLVSREALDRIGPLDEDVVSFHEWDTSIRLARFCRFVAPPEPVFVYDRGAADTISSSGLAEIRGYERVLEKHRDEILERAGDDAWNEHISFLLRRALDLGLWDEAGRLLSLVRERDRRYYAYATCRRLRLRPSYISRARGLVGRRAPA